MNFLPINIEQVKQLKPYFERTHYLASEYTTTLLYMWQDSLVSEVAFADGCAIFRVNHDTGCEYLLPVGRPLVEALEVLKRDLWTGECNPTLICIPQEHVETVKAVFPNAVADFRRKWSDYIYDIEQIKTLSGRRFQGQRNHKNRFVREYPNHAVHSINSQSIPLVKAFLDEFVKSETRDKPESYEKEYKAAVRGLDSFEELGLFGLYVTADDKIVSFAIGEAVGDMLYVHIEKADISYHGSYQFIVQAFAQKFGTEEIKYLNREDDSDDPGLRSSKMSYHPIRILDKYFCELNAKKI